jgi:small subunit ribosomal protein S9
MKSEMHYATGRRKTSSARIYLTKGKGDITVNDRKLDVYFGRKVAQMLVMQPLELTESTENSILKLWLKAVVVLDRLALLDTASLEHLFLMMKN